MALEVGDFVQKVTDSNVRGHVHQMDNNGLMAVEVDGELICGHQFDWEEVPSDSMEVQQQDEPESMEAQQKEPEAQQDDEASFFKRVVYFECQMSIK